jgi:serine/threonine protein kinase
MAKVIPIGEPVNEAERLAIAHLRDGLPDSFLILHNFEVPRDGELFEVDLAVVAPHAVYLVDVKGTRGLIEVHGPKWYPEGRQPYTSPLLKLGGHARSLKGIITASQPGRRDLEGIYVEGVVLLTSPDAVFQDPGARDAPSVTTLKSSLAFLQSAARVPGRFSKNIAAMHNMVLKALQGVARPKTGPLRFGNWEVTERLSATDQYVEYRAVNGFAGARSGSVILRSYQADPYLPEAEREAQRNRISNAYLALNRMSAHPCIVGARDFFPTESEDRYILVTEDVPGQALRLYIDKAHLALTLDQKLRIASDLLSALEHAHKHDVVHRHVTPNSILVGADGRLRLTGFDFARAGTDRSRTIADAIVDDLEPEYLAPEMHGEPSAATPGSDIFSAGLVLYELFTGERPFANASEVFEQSAKFSIKPSAYRNELAEGFDTWFQNLCTFDPASRPTATQAKKELDTLLHSREGGVEPTGAPKPKLEPVPEIPAVDYSQLSSGASLTHKYIVERRLGKPGAFGVVYKVIDTLGDVSRALKLILRDRHSTLERLKKEYRTLLRTPEHPNVVKVIDADLLPNNGPPFIVFEFIEGLDVGEMIDNGLFAPEDAVELARQVTAGLLHLHKHGVYHCDIKPRNLLWTDRGVKIIDFNVSVLSSADNGHGGGSRRYLPPDLDLAVIPQPSELADRDLYALGLTLFEAVTGRYPWDTALPPVGQSAPDPREWSGLGDLAPEFVDVMLKVISPKRSDRFSSVGELLYALDKIEKARRPVARVPELLRLATGTLGEGGTAPPNTNLYVSHLLTLYSQSQTSNAGTRGLDTVGQQTYVETALDRDLVPAVFAGEFSLVIISGNAGDGKTAFLQKLEKCAEEEGAIMDRSIANGCQFTLRGRSYLSNYDGSQDEGEHTSDAVLRAFFEPFAGERADSWPTDQVRLIAINEGRLVDFLSIEKTKFALLSQVVSEGLISGEPAHRVAVINLNLRSVVAAPTRLDSSILERLIRRMTDETYWQPCQNCNLKESCYAFHNARTFQDETASPKVIERLVTLYTLTHLRGRLHITLRDLRSALSFMLVGTRDCAEIHELYRRANSEEIAESYYFNSWMGGTSQNSDRLLSLLREVDVGLASDPKLDRSLDFLSPAEDRNLFRFGDRGTCDRDVLRKLFENLPRDFSGKIGMHRSNAHQAYVAMARRRNFFERRDAGWKNMLPYHTGDEMLALVRGVRSPEEVLPELLRAINRGEGLCDPERLGNSLALQVRNVTGGTIRSYRIYPNEGFVLEVCDDASRARFVEHMPSTLVLKYRTDYGSDAELPINLDVFEMLQRLNEGYRPSIEEEQGYYLSLTVFKNILGSVPYQEVLLTTSGHDFFKIQRSVDGRLNMERVSTGVE